MQAEAPRWNYFRLLEQDLEDSFRFVQPCPQHYSVYSEHFARIILIACTEIENCIKSMAVKANYQSSLGGIKDYNKFLISQYPYFAQSKVLLPWYGLTFEPWVNLGIGTTPDWWQSGYNKIKHDRENSPDAATLQRAVDSVAALFVLLLHYYHTLNGTNYTIPLMSQPRLFGLEEKPGDWKRSPLGWAWELPG